MHDRANVIECVRVCVYACEINIKEMGKKESGDFRQN